MKKFLFVLGCLGAAGSGALGGMTAGPVGAVVGAITGLTAFLSGRALPSPTAVKAFGDKAK